MFPYFTKINLGEKNMSEQRTTDVLKQVAGMSMGWAIVMGGLGVLAILMPFTTGIAVSIFVGWIMVFSGFAYLAYAFAAQGAGSFFWRTLVGIAYIVGGGSLTF